MSLTPPSPTTPTLTEAERTRNAAALALGARGAEGVDGLVAMLDDPSWPVRRTAVASLAGLGDAAVPALCRVLREERGSEARIAAAVDALSASTGPGTEVVVERELAEHPLPAVAADAAQILGRRRNPAAVPALVRLATHADDNVAVMAIEGLGRVGGRAAVESLVAAVQSGNFFRTFPAIDVLGRSGDPRAVEPLARLLREHSYTLEAARALGRTGERAAAAPLVALLAMPSDALARVACVALGELLDRHAQKTGGEGKLEPLVRQLAPASSTRRLVGALNGAEATEAAAVARLLGLVGGEEAVPALTQRLTDPAPAVARAAAEALRRLGRESDARVAEALREEGAERRKALLPVLSRRAAAPHVVACLGDPDPDVRTLACDTLGRLGNPDVVRPLFGLLADPNPRVAQAAMGAIEALGNEEARALALEAARAPDARVRRAALRILAYFGHPAGLAPMLAALEDADPKVRDAALQGLPYLEDPRALQALLEAARAEDPRRRATALRALGNVVTGDARVPALLLGALKDPDPWARYYAAQALGKLGVEAAAPQLAGLLGDDAGQVRVAAVEALAHLERPTARDALRLAAQSAERDVRRAALIGLGLGARTEDLPVLLAAADPEEDPATRLVALSAMAEFPAPEVLAALAEAAGDADEQVSTAAVGFLAARRDPGATGALVRLLRVPAVRDRAENALALRTPQRVAGLAAALDAADDELAVVLCALLARLGGDDARAALLGAMQRPNAAARKAAASTLAALDGADAVAVLRHAAANDPDPAVRHICALLLA